jgi:hypothetical protein
MLDPDTSVWASSLSTAASGVVRFSLSLSQSRQIAILGDTFFLTTTTGPHFSANSTVTIGGVPANITNASLFGADGAEPLPSHRRALGDPASRLNALYVTSPSYAAMCPTDAACAGANGYKQIIVTNPMVMAGQGAWSGSEGGTVSCPPYCPGSNIGDVGGVYYTSVCVGYAQGQVCLDPATASQCAFGSGDSCKRCPVGGICPGGQRCW